MSGGRICASRHRTLLAAPPPKGELRAEIEALRRASGVPHDGRSGPLRLSPPSNAGSTARARSAAIRSAYCAASCAPMPASSLR